MKRMVSIDRILNSFQQGSNRSLKICIEAGVCKPAAFCLIFAAQKTDNNVQNAYLW